MYLALSALSRPRPRFLRHFYSFLIFLFLFSPACRMVDPRVIWAAGRKLCISEPRESERSRVFVVYLRKQDIHDALGTAIVARFCWCSRGLLSNILVTLWNIISRPIVQDLATYVGQSRCIWSTRHSSSICVTACMWCMCLSFHWPQYTNTSEVMISRFGLQTPLAMKTKKR